MLCILRRTDTEGVHIGRQPCDDRGKDWGIASTSQGRPREPGLADILIYDV